MLSAFADIVGKLPKNKNKLKTIGFCPAMASYAYVSFAPPERGGRADFKAKVSEEAKVSGRSVEDVADDVRTELYFSILCNQVMFDPRYQEFHTFTDEICQMPGFPEMYHWEFDPQDTRVGHCTIMEASALKTLFQHITKGSMGAMWMSTLHAYDVFDGMIITSPEPYEPHAIAATKEWFAETHRDVWAIGPLLPSTASKEAVAGEGALSETSEQIKAFMDDVLRSQGEHSMLFVRR